MTTKAMVEPKVDVEKKDKMTSLQSEISGLVQKDPVLYSVL